MYSDFITIFDFPKTCELNKVIYKKFFFDNASLNVTEKKALKEDVEKIKWLYTLKPDTININEYIDETREYLEIAVLLIELNKINRTKCLSELIHKSIPYPLMILFSFENKISISIANKRINQADKHKWVVEDILATEWIDFKSPSGIDSKFIDDCNVKKLSTVNYYSFYQDIKVRIIAHLSSLKTGKYDTGKFVEKSDKTLEQLNNIEKLETEQLELKNKLKKEKQMGRKVDLNTKIRELTLKIENLLNQL